MQRSIVFLFVIILIVLGAFGLSSFLQSNMQPTRLQFLGFQTKEISLAVLVLLSFLLGLLISSLFLMSSTFSKHLEARRFRRENQALQKILEKKEALQKGAEAEQETSTPTHQK